MKMCQHKGFAHGVGPNDLPCRKPNDVERHYMERAHYHESLAKEERAQGNHLSASHNYRQAQKMVRLANAARTT